MKKERGLLTVLSSAQRLQVKNVHAPQYQRIPFVVLKHCYAVTLSQYFVGYIHNRKTRALVVFQYYADYKSALLRILILLMTLFLV